MAGTSSQKPTQIDRLADMALEGLEDATPEMQSLALQAAVYKQLKNGGGRCVAVPMRAAFAFGVGMAARMGTAALGAVKVL